MTHGHWEPSGPLWAWLIVDAILILLVLHRSDLSTLGAIEFALSQLTSATWVVRSD